MQDVPNGAVRKQRRVGVLWCGSCTLLAEGGHWRCAVIMCLAVEDSAVEEGRDFS
jgi:hypothetical protein